MLGTSALWRSTLPLTSLPFPASGLPPKPCETALPLHGVMFNLGMKRLEYGVVVKLGGLKQRQRALVEIVVLVNNAVCESVS